MDRDIYHNLLEWKISTRRKPLILRGARQVGKTYILQKFSKQEYNNYIYINFDEEPSLAQLFFGDLKPKNILQAMRIHFDQEIKPNETLLIFDEIQECPNALNSLKYFNEQANEFHIVAAGSLLGVKLANSKGFPVGKVNFLDLYPLSFFEFLDAVGKTKLRSYLESIHTFEPTAEPIHLELINLLKTYMFVGGMPEAVAYYSAKAQINEIRDIHKEILQAYVLDFAKHAPSNQVMKITTIWESIVNQLAKENKKFIFSAINKSARAREYETAIQWLADAGLIYKAYNVSTPKMPLAAYCDNKAFKIFLLDVGLLGAMGKIPPKIIINGDKLFSEYNGAVTENFVAQELIYKQNSLYYWTSEGKAEIDFVVTHNNDIFPLEVKAGISKQKRSLHVYSQKYNPQLLLRASLMNLKKDGIIANYPLYMVNKLFAFLK
jgi:predicted AAA+ superfamily ATPase